MSRPTFPGLGVFLDQAVEGEDDAPRLRAQLADQPLLGELADLAGQAIAAPREHAAGILAEAQRRAAALHLAAEAARAVLAYTADRLPAPGGEPDDRLATDETPARPKAKRKPRRIRPAGDDAGETDPEPIEPIEPIEPEPEAAQR